TLADRWHIGSCTKSMTATLAAMLVEEGKISWTTTVDEMFPELAEKMQPAYRSVTLEQLLAHRGGLPDDTKGGTEVFLKLRQFSGPIVEQRLKLVELALQQKPKDPPGTKYGYSNYGYAIAGAMLEKTTGRSWEELLQERLFKPLKMSSAGFGAPGRENPVDEPRGHVRRLGKLIPIKPGPNGDNPACMGPCGTVHCSIEDLARYALFHLQGARGRNHILEPKSFQKLHGDIEKQGYALGWGVVERSWADGEALTHTGSNTMWFTVVWIAPKKDFAVVIATNTGQPDAFSACDAVAWQTIEKQLIKPAKVAN
ncbi:MAG: serine hydrolase domain-containing protein, partial [Verrucomicrobiota bacterium]